jgi:putative redox protein
LIFRLAAFCGESLLLVRYTGLMKTVLEWKQGYRFDAALDSGAALTFDNAEDDETPAGPSPMEAFLASLAACTAMDVIGILEKKRQNVESYRIEIEADRNSPGDWPRPFKSFRLNHIVSGDVDENALARAIELSEDKYCSVSATLKITPPITNTWTIE